MANINLLSEIPLAQRLKAEGVGLYRSEFPFIVRNDIPTEEEQVRIYSGVLDALPGYETILRTLDVGGDKILAYYPASEESNPFMGLRAIRFLLRNPDIFTQQVRAMLRAGADRPLHIMFPLVSSVDDFIQAREVVAHCIHALANEGLPHNSAPSLGIMVEVPSAVELAREFARETDFLCIGSNDLIQYTLAVDRTNAKIADLFVPYHPAVLRALKKVADAAIAADKPVSLCGDMASDERMVPFLVGAGIHRLSMESSRIPPTQQLIERMSYSAARRLAADLLELPTLKAVERRLKEGVGA
jgi:phosphotransferase system enzyme I (PtsP)